MAKTLEELFQEEKANVAPKPKEKRMAPGKNLEDLFSDTPMEMIEVDPAAEEAALRVVGKNLFAIPGGMLRGASAEYSKELEPEAMKKFQEDYGVGTGFGRLIGAVAPATAATKAVSGVGRLLKLPSLARAGVRSGAAAGALQGVLTNPEAGSSRLNNALFGAAVGAPAGLLGKGANTISEQTEILDRLQGSGDSYKKEVKNLVDQAIESMMANQVTPRKEKLTRILGEAAKKGEIVKINPDYLRGLQRESSKGIPRKKGGLDRLANILESKYGSPENVTVSPLRAQKLKEYFQDLANYQARRTVEPGSVAKNEGAADIATSLKNKLEGIDPRVSSLNEPMEEALTLKRNILDATKERPIGYVSSKPETDTGQNILELDRLAKSKLSRLGGNIREAKQMQYDLENAINPLMSPSTIYRAAKRNVGRAINKAKFLPEGTRNTPTSLILQGKTYEEEEE